ncbi:class I SAM-dependent methyltransferase [Blastococcus sp. SYSU D00695]
MSEQTGAGARLPVWQRLARPVARAVVSRLEARMADVVRAEADRVIGEVLGAEFRARRDVLAAGERAAAASSCEFQLREMPTARVFHDALTTLRHGLEVAPDEGMALEFGVFQGRSLRVITDGRPGKEVYGFDSFAGLPEDYRPHVRQGTFAVDGLPDVPGAELVVGWFDETLPGFLAEHPGPVAFLHVDGDLYSSAVTVLDLVGPRLRPGSVVVFDEFFNFPGWQQHEYRAWQEWLARTGARAEYLAYTQEDEQVAIRVLDPGRAADLA